MIKSFYNKLRIENLILGRSLLQLLVFSFLVSTLYFCSAEPEADRPGSCKLDCGSAKIAGSEFKITPLTQVGDVECGIVADGAYSEVSKPVLTKFLVTAPRIKAVPKPIASSDDTGDDNVLPTDFEDTEAPVGGVSFQPIVYGALSPGKTNAENADVSAGSGDVDPLLNFVVTPAQFSGIVTPKSEWCSDTCGVMSLEIWPLCIGGDSSNNVRVFLMSGGASSGANGSSVEFNVVSESP